MEIPPDNGGMGAEGLRGVLFPADQDSHFIHSTHLAAVHKDTEMEVTDRDDEILEKMHALLSNTRSQLTRAVEEANQLQAWSSDEEGADNHLSGTARVEEPDAEALAKMSTKEREAAIKRARNREAARRSRQRKNERINQLCREIKTLQQENVVLLKCIEDFTKKAINSKEYQLRMKEQLAALATTSTTAVDGIDTPSLLAHYQDDSMLLPMEIEELTTAATVATVATPAEAELELDGPGPSSRSIIPSSVTDRATLVAGLSLPSLAELQKLQNTEGGGGPLTTRGGGGGGGTLSARGAAVAEHIAMLSKENSPRDDEIDPGRGTGEPSLVATEKQMVAAATNAASAPQVGQFFSADTAADAAAAPLPAVLDGDSVDINMLFGAWNGSDRK